MSTIGLLGVWEIACPALSMLASRQSARKLFINSGGVGFVIGALNRLGKMTLQDVTHCVDWTSSFYLVAYDAF